MFSDLQIQFYVSSGGGCCTALTGSEGWLGGEGKNLVNIIRLYVKIFTDSSPVIEPNSKSEHFVTINLLARKSKKSLVSTVIDFGLTTDHTFIQVQGHSLHILDVFTKY